MRRYMMRIAEHFAKKDNCLGLITGESIGQVASQTLQSLAATNEVCTLPVYRPVHPLLVTPLGIAYNCELPPVAPKKK